MHPDQIVVSHFVSDDETERTIKGYVPAGRHHVRLMGFIGDKPATQVYFLQSFKDDFDRQIDFELEGPRKFQLTFRLRDRSKPDHGLKKEEYGDQIQIVLEQESLETKAESVDSDTQMFYFDVPRIRIVDQAATGSKMSFFPGSLTHVGSKFRDEHDFMVGKYRPPNFLGKEAFVLIGKTKSGQKKGVEIVPFVYSDAPLSMKSSAFLHLKGLFNSQAKFNVEEDMIDQCSMSIGPWGNLLLNGPAAEQIQSRPVSYTHLTLPTNREV